MPKGVYQHKPLSEERRRRISEIARERYLSGKNPNFTNRGRKFTEEHKKKISESHKGKNKNHTVWNKGRDCEQLKGKNHWNWKGGISEENELIRKSVAYKEWRNKVYKKFNYTCQICSKKCNSKEIIAHHLLLFSSFPTLRFSVKNGKVLCRKCHVKLHKFLNKNLPF